MWITADQRKRNEKPLTTKIPFPKLKNVVDLEEFFCLKSNNLWLYHEMEESRGLCCSVCYNAFTSIDDQSVPRNLNCGHTFCTGMYCMIGFILSTTFRLYDLFKLFLVSSSTMLYFIVIPDQSSIFLWRVFWSQKGGFVLQISQTWNLTSQSYYGLIGA